MPHPSRHPVWGYTPVFVLTVAVLTGCARIARTMMITQMKVAALVGSKEIEIELNRTFIERYRDRVTIAARLTVDETAVEPNGPLFDGDFHFAARSPNIGLPIIAEIINAAHQRKVTDLIHRVEESRRPVTISGVWRIWPEHGGRQPEIQNAPVDSMMGAYADHVFEIHPVTRIEGFELLDSFTPVPGYRPGSARRTFAIFEKATARFRVTPTTIVLGTQNGLYNDVHFLMEITEDRQVVVPDGRFVTASARELDGDLLVDKLRMVFVKETAPEHLVRRLERGDRLHVWGLPRVSYAEIARRVTGTEAGGPELTGPLPYEIVVLGVYPD